jgi:glycosyltransferase involved in cell wall biosynthesis
MERQLITVVTVVFNGARSLEKTILSVIQQAYPNIEYIVIDGGSTDGTLEILKKYRNFISKLIIETDKGIYDAMNKGIVIANGEWINFMNAGDSFVDKNVISEMFKDEIDEEVQVIFGDINYLFDNKILRRDTTPNSYREVPKYICHQATFVRSNYLKRNLFDLSFKICSDYKLLNDYLINGGLFEHKQVCVANYDMFGYSFYNLLTFHKEFIRITKNKSYLNYIKNLLIAVMIKFFPGTFKNIYYKKIIKNSTITIIQH